MSNHSIPAYTQAGPVLIGTQPKAKPFIRTPRFTQLTHMQNQAPIESVDGSPLAIPSWNRQEAVVDPPEECRYLGPAQVNKPQTPQI